MLLVMPSESLMKSFFGELEGMIYLLVKHSITEIVDPCIFKIYSIGEVYIMEDDKERQTELDDAHRQAFSKVFHTIDNKSYMTKR